MNPKRVGFLIYPGMQALDLAGPMDAFADVSLADGKGRRRPGNELLTIGFESKAVPAESGLLLTPQFTTLTAPKLDTLVDPGGCAMRETKTAYNTAAEIIGQSRQTRRGAAAPSQVEANTIVEPLLIGACPSYLGGHGHSHAPRPCRRRNTAARSRPHCRRRHRSSLRSIRRLFRVSGCPLPQWLGVSSRRILRRSILGKWTTAVLIVQITPPLPLSRQPAVFPAASSKTLRFSATHATR